MPGLLDITDDPNTAGLLSLGLRLMSTPGKFGTALGQAGLGAMGDLQQARQMVEQRKLREQQAKMQGLQMQSLEQQLADAQRARQESERIRSLVASQFAPVQPIEANAASGIAGPRPEALSAVGERRRIDPQALLAQGVPLDLVKGLMESPNFGRAKVARTVEVDDGQGGKQTVQLDDYGNRVGAGMPGYIAPVQVNQGDRVTFTRPQAGVSLPVGMSPDAKASNAVAWANYGLGRDRLTFDQSQPKNQYDADRGVLVDTRNGVATPVMQGGQALGPKQKDLNDAQSKALLFGTRAQKSDQILADVNAESGVDRPGNIKAMGESLPFIGGAAGPILNWTQSSAQQSVEQAQRDFINAVLRRESGAVISPEEFDNARKQYFPQIGDSKRVREQKANNRKTAIEGILQEVPSGRRPGAAQSDNDPLGLRN